MSALTKLDAYYSSFSDPAAVYTYPSVLNIAINGQRVYTHASIEKDMNISVEVSNPGNLAVDLEGLINWTVFQNPQNILEVPYSYTPVLNANNSSLAAFITNNITTELPPISEATDTDGFQLRPVLSFLLADFNEQDISEPKVFTLTNHSFRITGD